MSEVATENTAEVNGTAEVNTNMPESVVGERYGIEQTFTRSQLRKGQADKARWSLKPVEPKTEEEWKKVEEFLGVETLRNLAFQGYTRVAINLAGSAVDAQGNFNEVAFKKYISEFTARSTTIKDMIKEQTVLRDEMIELASGTITLPDGTKKQLTDTEVVKLMREKGEKIKELSELIEARKRTPASEEDEDDTAEASK